uniref:Large ribosomal subunit protein bL20c n=1 Tax=Solanum lycopersicum TaxID=4081 RepID=A0A3Q7HAQ1_SOLLC
MRSKTRTLVLSHLDIDRKKRDIHPYYYSRLIHNLYKRLLLLNHKILSQIAISIKNCLYMFSNLLSSILVDQGKGVW